MKSTSLAALVCTVLSCSCLSDQGRTAVVAIPVESVKVYLKSHAWGLNGFSAVLSLDPDSMRVPQPRDWSCCPGDYAWRADSPPGLVFRSFEGALHIWEVSATSWQAPTNGPLGALVKFHVVDIQTLHRMSVDPGRYGVFVIRDADLPYAEPPVQATPLSLLMARDAR